MRPMLCSQAWASGRARAASALTLARSPRSSPRPCLMSARSAEMRTRRSAPRLVAIGFGLQLFLVSHKSLPVELRGPQVEQLIPPPLALLPGRGQRIRLELREGVAPDLR